LEHDLTELLRSLVGSDCDDILVIGSEGREFPRYEQYGDPRVRTLVGPHPLSAKRNVALEAATGDILAYLDDDAVVSQGWCNAVRAGFQDPGVGIVTGPSMLGPQASLWKRAAQLAMAGTPYSRRRYMFDRPGYVEWHDVIGANVAFRRTALRDAGGCPSQFLAQGDDMAMAFNVTRRGWKVFYAPDAFVYHEPHAFLRQVVQIHRYGRAAVRLRRAGIRHPRVDPAYALFVPAWILFACAYVFGTLKEWLIADYDIRLRRALGRGGRRKPPGRAAQAQEPGQK
jgi:GT2 family glycosyltransferase